MSRIGNVTRPTNHELSMKGIYDITVMQTKTIANIMKLIDSLPLRLRAMSNRKKQNLSDLRQLYDDGIMKQKVGHAPIASWEYNPRDVQAPNYNGDDAKYRDSIMNKGYK